MSKVELGIFKEEIGEGLTESAQRMNVRFAYVDAKYNQIMRQVKCKDYMNVPIWSKATGINGKRIYGWTYSYDKTPFDGEVTRISLNFTETSSATNFKENIGFLNAIEAKWGIGLTVVYETQFPNIVVIEGDKVWQSNIWKMSLYMVYLRRMGYDRAIPDGASSDFRYREELAKNDMEAAWLSIIHQDFEENFEGVDSAHSSSGVSTYNYYYNYTLNGGYNQIYATYLPVIDALIAAKENLKKAA